MTDPTRRTLVRGAAWTVPVVAIAAAAPAFATSLRKDPGINGWVLNSTDDRGNRRYNLRVDSNPAGGTTPDGAPFGLYVYDTNTAAGAILDTLTAARLVYWIIGTQTEGATWAPNPGHGTGWSTPSRGATQVKPDGLAYTPYTFEYSGPFTLRDDGRVWLQEFDTTASFRQPANRDGDVTYWTQRFITVNGVTETFERRNGTRGPFTSNARQAQTAAARSAVS